MDSLFTNKNAINPSDTDPEFRAVRDHEQRRELRECLDRPWNRYRKYGDAHFLDQIQRRGHFHSRVWELRLGCALLDAAYDFTSPDEGPDFTVGKLPFHIEAVAPAIGPKDPTAPAPVREASRKLFDGEFVMIPDDEIIFRFTSAFREKRRKYGSWLRSALVGENEPFVIAVSGANFAALIDPSHPLVLHPLFGITGMTGTFRASSEPPLIGYEAGVQRIKSTGAPVDNFLFGPLTESNGGAAVEVSAVIFSDTNRPYADQFNEFVCIHNPNAKNPICEGFLPFGREFAKRENAIELVNDYRPAKARSPRLT